MKKLLILLALLCASPALAQPVQCPDQPTGNSTNACANTRFVINNAGSGTTALPQNQIFVGNASNLATAVNLGGDCTIVAAGTITCTKTNGSAFGTMASQNANAVAITGGTGIFSTATITAATLSAGTVAGTPAAATDIANKSYVDSVASGRTPLAPVRLATTAVLSNTPTYANGAAGVGATLTAGSNGVLSIDSTVVNSADRVLVKDQASALQNGCYTLTTVGTGSVAYILTRCIDSDTAAELPNGLTGLVTAGTINTNTSWTLNQPAAITVGTTALPWVQTGATTVSYWTLTGSDIYKNNAGNVGIGTTTPASPLSVNIADGSVRVEDSANVGNLLLAQASGAFGPIVEGHTDAAGNSTFAAPSQRISVGNAGFIVANSPTTTVGSPRTYTSRMILDSSNNVGIGTTTPAAKLDIQSPSGVAFNTLFHSGGNTVGDLAVVEWTRLDGTVDLNAFGNANGSRIKSLTSLAFHTGDTGITTTNQRMTIDASGNVGIGVTAPAAGALFQVGNATPTSVYYNVQDPTLQQAVCYGFGAGNCETDAFLSHMHYTASAVTTGAAIRGEVLTEKVGGTAIGVSGIASNVSTGAQAELVGVIGVNDYNGPNTTGVAVWGITAGSNAVAGATAALGATNRATFIPAFGLSMGMEGAATRSYDIGIQIYDANSYGVKVGGSGNTTLPVFPYALQNNGGSNLFTVDSGGNERAVSNTATSDERLKNISGPFSKGLKELATIKPILYHWKDNPSGLIQAGVSAQNVQKEFPEAVSADAQGTLGVNDRPLVAALINAVKDLQGQITQLKEQINAKQIPRTGAPHGRRSTQPKVR